MQKKQAEWAQEQARIDWVIEKIRARITALVEESGAAYAEHLALSKSFWEDISMDPLTADDALEAAADIAQQQLLIDELRRRLKSSGEDKQILVTMLGSPYFARIDLKDDASRGGGVMQLYLGIKGLYDEESGEDLIIDWRAPVASLFYDASLGPASYETPLGEQNVELLKKRQYVIRQGKLKAMFDTSDVAIGDEVLREVLSQGAGHTLSVQVATIQKEQNAIIRDSESAFLFVQGVAGSGKTSVALQRVAYLMYRYRSRLTSDALVVISPNPLFKQYTAHVLPELGAEQVTQRTMAELIREVLAPYDVLDPSVEIDFFLSGNGSPERRHEVERRLQLTSNEQMVDILEAYLEKIYETGPVFRDLTEGDVIWFHAEEIEAMYRALAHEGVPREARIHGVATRLKTMLKHRAKELSREPWVDRAIEALPDVTLQKIYQLIEKRQHNASDVVYLQKMYEAHLRAYVVKQKASLVREAIVSRAFIDFVQTYRALYEDERFKSLLPDRLLAVENSETVRKRLDRPVLDYWDALRIAWLKLKLTGTVPRRETAYCVVDEAQDLTPLELSWLLSYFPRARFTFLGDRFQALLPLQNVFHIESGHALYRCMGERGPIQSRALLKSYRVTQEIAAFARHVLPEAGMLEAFPRHGTPVKLLTITQHDHVTAVLKDIIETLIRRGHGLIAMICKTDRACDELEAYIGTSFSYQRVKTDTQQLKGPVFIIPSVLAKGIEFDAAILYDVSSQNYHSSLDRYLLHMIAMRAKHELWLVSIGEPSPFLEGVPLEPVRT
ncbi:MAG: ATP-dependent DNA helicase rep [Candidatus Carbobacillus altaicus]|uniref:ATP-dependent DNA helicase rep n=1 Tax=Candidatus Carbonibacillus altaicus TaxID=2163959 RepID=A0A2R6Y5F8_9BACL|nr:MAG: ATP-dependent DNA helicase rep [Candidatus Carbobacillus altaicus]